MKREKIEKLHFTPSYYLSRVKNPKT